MGSDLYVIETDDDAFVGTIEFVEGGVLIRDGFVGRPRLIEAIDLVSLTPALQHPDVVFYEDRDTVKLDLAEFFSDDYIRVG